MVLLLKETGHEAQDQPPMTEDSLKQFAEEIADRFRPNFFNNALNQLLMHRCFEAVKDQKWQCSLDRSSEPKFQCVDGESGFDDSSSSKTVMSFQAGSLVRRDPGWRQEK
jgi:hypothetical protein